MEFRNAQENDTMRIMELIRQAKAFLKANGVDQWQDGYPEQEDIERDIRDGIGYVMTDDSIIMAYTGIDFRGEPAYDSLKNGKYIISVSIRMKTIKLCGTSLKKWDLPIVVLSFLPIVPRLPSKNAFIRTGTGNNLQRNSRRHMFERCLSGYNMIPLM